MRTFCLLLITVVMALAANSAAAQVLGPQYPPPGGNTFSNSGSSVQTGGATWNYGGFDSSQYNQLWWGEEFVNNVCSPTGCTNGTMSFTSYDQATGVAIWTNSTPWTFTSGFGGPPVSVTPEFVLQLTAGTVAEVSPAGFPGSPAFVVPITGSSFTVNFEYEIGGVSISDYFNHFNGGAAQGFQTSNQSGFYYTAPLAATPEPTSILGFGTGLFLIGGILRRRLFAV